MVCQNQPEKEATGACVGCGKMFCAECLLEINGKNYCHNCVQTLVNEKDKEIDKASSNHQPMVFMNAGGAAASSSSSSSSGSRPVVPPYPRNKVGAHILLFCFTAGIGNLIYFFYIRSRQKEWEAKYTNN